MTFGSPLGFNVCLRAIDWGKIIPRLQAVAPRVVVGFVDSMNDFPKVEALRNVLPNTVIVGRMYLPDKNEGKFHLHPEAPGDNREYIATPSDVIDTWGKLGRNGLSFNVFNEPGTDNPSHIARQVQWACDAIDYGVATQTRLTMMNWATGTPQLVGDQLDPHFDPVLKRLSQYRDFHTLGVHEYLPEPGRIGRVSGIFKRCDVLGLPPPQVILTEFGWDNDGTNSNLNGYHSRHISGGDYARQQIDLIERVYRPYIDSKKILGICTFTLGNSGIWEQYDVANDDEYWKVISAWKYQPASPPVVVQPVAVAPTVHVETTVQPAAPIVPAVTTSEPPQIANKYAKLASLFRQIADELDSLAKAS